MALFTAYNSAMAAAAAPTAITTGTSIKTLMQLKPGANSPISIVEWGISFDGSAAAVPIKCELVGTGTVFATVTAYSAADIIAVDDPNAPAPNVSVGTSASGFTSSSEGTVTATTLYDLQLIAPTNQYWKQFPLGAQPKVKVATALRIRVTAPVAVNALCYITWSE